MTVLFDQSLDADPVYPGFNDDGAAQKTSGVYHGGLSYSVRGNVVRESPVLGLSAGAEFTYFPITYKMITLSGESELDSVIKELFINAAATLSFINILNLSPTVSVRYERTWTEISGADNVDFSNEWLFFMGATKRF